MSTIGSFILAFSVLLFLINIFVSRRAAQARSQFSCENDPWDARSVEWLTTSPPPDHNFDQIPEITELDELWHRKYAEDEHGRLTRIARTEDVVDKGVATNVHLPSPSYWPLVSAVGLMLVGYGIIFSLALCAVGGFILIVGLFGWGLEPSDNEDLTPHGPQGHDDAGHGAQAQIPQEEVAGV